MATLCSLSSLAMANRETKNSSPSLHSLFHTCRDHCFPPSLWMNARWARYETSFCCLHSPLHEAQTTCRIVQAPRRSKRDSAGVFVSSQGLFLMVCGNLGLVMSKHHNSSEIPGCYPGSRAWHSNCAIRDNRRLIQSLIISGGSGESIGFKI
jgi:hypothetical protein